MRMFFRDLFVIHCDVKITMKSHDFTILTTQIILTFFQVVGKNILEDIQKDLDTKCKEVEELAKYCREVKDRYHKLREMYEESTKKLNTEIDTRSKMENRVSDSYFFYFFF